MWCCHKTTGRCKSGDTHSNPALSQQRDVKAAGPTWLVVSLQHHSSGNKRKQISEAKGNVGAKTFSRKRGETCRCTPGAAQPERENKPTAVAGK